MAFPDALRFILAVKASGIRVAAASSSKNAKLFLERIRLDTFAAEQRLEYGFIRPGMTLQELFDADISGRDFPKGKPDPTIFLTAAAGARRPPGRLLRGRGRPQRDPGRQGRRAWRRSGWPGWTTGTCWSRRAPTWSCPPWTTSRCRRWPRGGWRSGGRPPSSASGTPSGPRASGRWSTTASTPSARGCARRCARSATDTSSPGAPCPRLSRRGQLPGDLRRRALQPAGHRDRRAQGRERGPGERAQLAAARLPGRRRAVVRRPAGRRPRAPPGAGHAPGDAPAAAGLAGRRGPAHPRRPAPFREHEGRAPRRPRDHLHGRELVGDPGGPLRAGRPGGQRRGQALPRPERPAPGRA